jgi:hypothetical protein
LTEEKNDQCSPGTIQRAGRDGGVACRAHLDFILNDLLADTSASVVSPSAREEQLLKGLDGLRQRLAAGRFQLARSWPRTNCKHASDVFQAKRDADGARPNLASDSIGSARRGANCQSTRTMRFCKKAVLPVCSARMDFRRSNVYGLGPPPR